MPAVLAASPPPDVPAPTGVFAGCAADDRRRVAAEIEGPVVALAELEDPAACRRLLAQLKRETRW